MKTIKDIEYSFNHTKDRFKERYDIDISKNDYDHLCDITRNNFQYIDFVSVEKQKHDTQYVIDLPSKFKGKNIRIVWSIARDCVTTVLPEENRK